MPLPKFKYLAPKSLKEASAMLAEHGDKARLMAGGTDLIIRMSHRAVTPDYVIGLKHLSGLGQVSFDPEKGLTIGALARLSDVAGHPDLRRQYPALARAAELTATVQIRNMGTVVGNICNAAPSADTATPLLVHGAEVRVINPGGERAVPLTEFFRGPGLTALEQGEVVREIRVPPPGPRSGSDYQKLSARGRVDIAGVGVSAYVNLDEAGAMAVVRVALGAVAPVPLRSRYAEKALQGQTPDPDLISRAAREAAQEAAPITDVRGSAAWRRGMVEVLTVRALNHSLDVAGQRLAGCEI